jgi:hypothetical protein
MEKINWKIAADRVTIGERTELKTIPGYWVRPRRFSKQGEAEILAAQTRAMAKSKAVAASMMDGFKDAVVSDADKMTGGISDDAKKEIAIKVMQGATADMIGHVEEDVMRIAYGIAEHNFLGDQEPACVEWAREIIEYKDVANEILEIVREKNLPLVLPTPSSSPTLPTGSLTDPDSEAKAGMSEE